MNPADALAQIEQTQQKAFAEQRIPVWYFGGIAAAETAYQLSLDAGSGPSCASLALPAKLITSPTFQVVPAAGAVIVAAGGVLPTLIGTAAVLDAPALSVTRRLAV